MSKVDAVISDINEEWQEGISALDAKLEGLEKRQTTCEEKLEATEKHWFLKRLFTRASAKRKLADVESKIDGVYEDMSALAIDTFTNLGEATLKAPENQQQQKFYTQLSSLLGDVEDTRLIVTHAMSECEEASGYEVADALTDNKGLDLLSYLETDEAKDALKEAHEAVDYLAKKLGKVGKDFNTAAASIGSGNNWDGLLDMMGAETAGNFMSLSNMGKLDDAVEALKHVVEHLDDVDTGILRHMRSVLAEVLEPVRQANPAVRETIQDLNTRTDELVNLYGKPPRR